MKPAVVVEVKKTETLTIGLDVETVAAWFCELNDEHQADFFIAVARRAEGWTERPENQWIRIGQHLRNCSCSTDEAREMVRALAHPLAQ